MLVDSSFDSCFTAFLPLKEPDRVTGGEQLDEDAGDDPEPETREVKDAIKDRSDNNRSESISMSTSVSRSTSFMLDKMLETTGSMTEEMPSSSPSSEIEISLELVSNLDSVAEEGVCDDDVSVDPSSVFSS